MFGLVGMACVVDGSAPPGRSPRAGDSAETQDSGDLTGEFVLAADRWVSLPYVEVGGTFAADTLTISNLGGAPGERLTVEVDGPFTVDGERSALEAGESREFTVTCTHATNKPYVATGTATIRSGDQSVTVGLSALVGTADLAEAEWSEDAWGTWTILPLPSAPFPDGHASWDDPSVMIALPPGYADSGGMGLVTHLHGHNATLADVVAEQFLREQFAVSGRNAVFVVPQGPEESADSDFGKLDLEGGYSNLLLDVQSVLYRDGLVVRPNVSGTVLSSHSGGYAAVANMIQVGGVEIGGVHLFDSLYGYESVYSAFIEDGGLFRSVYTSAGGTEDNNRALSSDLEDAGYDVSHAFGDGDLGASTLTIGPSGASHGGCVSEDRAYGRWLAASGLGASPGAPPELLSATVADGRAAVRWRADLGGERTVQVESSADGVDWEVVATSTGSHAEVPASPWIRVRATEPEFGESAPSDRYGATGAAWLVVDGFDRILDGSWTKPTHDFGARVGGALGAGFSVASNEAVAEGRALLGDYPHVLWILGDESSADFTFSSAEMDAVAAYVEAGGSIVVSGSEVGWASDSGWLKDTLHAALSSDDAGTVSVGDWTVGDQYTEDYPDVLTGDTVIWRWSTGGAAAVGWDKRVVVVGFGLENLDDSERAAAVGELAAWVGG